MTLKKPRYPGPVTPPLTLADVCCGAGTAADGYTAVGVDVQLGIDNEPQPDYPSPFVLADARGYLAPGSDLEWYDGLHFSWPCQAHTDARHLRTAQGGVSRFPDLLSPALPLIREHWSHKLWVVENVEDRTGHMRRIMAPGPGEYLTLLCGSMFGLEVQRHRLFLTNFPVRQPPCRHDRFPLDPVTGKPRPWGVYHVKGDSIPDGGRTARDEEHARRVMGVHRSLRWESIKEGFPPAYTSHVGADMLRAWLPVAQPERVVRSV